jgi:putative tryptophan/tyrosine transport system substrate-binding protein
VVPSRVTVLHLRPISAFALAHRLPAISGWATFARAGCLLTYGPNLDGSVRRAASHVDRILKGTKPDELPVEQPTTFDFAINLKSAQALGLTVPQSILQQATEVIQ